MKRLALLSKSALMGLGIAFLGGQVIADGDLATARLVASKSEVLNFMKTAGAVTNAKLVFQTGRFLYFIDYSAATPTITKMANTSGAISPMISPNGQFVTYATDTSKGVASDFGDQRNPSTAWISGMQAAATPVAVCRDSGYDPRFVYGASEPTIIYSTSGKNPVAGKGVWEGSGRTVKKLVTGGTTVGAEQVVWNGGSYWCGLSKDNRYLVHAQAQENFWMLDLQNSANGPAVLYKGLFHNNTTNKDSVVSLGQVCNASISPSSIFTNMAMFFTTQFTAPTGWTNVIAKMGDYWPNHERIFITRYDGTIIKWYDVPYNIKKPSTTTPVANQIRGVDWYNPEWSSNPYYAVACLYVDRLQGGVGAWTHKMVCENLMLINLKDSTYLNLVETTDTTAVQSIATDMMYPWLWIDSPAGFTEDASWLSTGIRASVSSPRATINGIHLSNTTLTSRDPLASVATYQLTGALVKHATLSGTSPRTCEITSDMFPARGTYFIRAKTVTGDRAVFRMTIVK